ncbi:MAG TPA: class I SAM-dependent methyltransferase [Chitinophagaceae bacterium]
MEPSLQRRVQRYGWDKASAYYEEFWQKQLYPAQKKLLEFATIKKGDKVIDIACGTGLVSFPAAEQTGENGFVVANDISDKMVEMGNAIARERKLPNINFLRMDAEELQVEDNSYDVALCALGFMYFPDPLKAFKEMYRSLKPGGHGVVAVWGRRKNCGWAEVFEIVDKRVSSEVCPMFFNLGNEGTLQQYMNAGGFKNISIERINTVLEYGSDDEACGAAFLGGPVALAYSKFSDEVKKEACKEYIVSIKSFREGNSYHVPGEFVVAIGFK